MFPSTIEIFFDKILLLIGRSYLCNITKLIQFNHIPNFDKVVPYFYRKRSAFEARPIPSVSWYHVRSDPFIQGTSVTQCSEAKE